MVNVNENTLEDMIGDIVSKNYTSAGNAFEDLLGDKLKDALDAKKVSIAGSIFGDENPEEYSEDEEV
jgi:hypothetical protein